jgi:hypothetical protein
MLIMQARELGEGDTIWDNGENEEITFLGGPWQNANQAVWFVVARDGGGIVRLFNLNHISLKRVEPVKGSVWVMNIGRKAFVAGVTDDFVIFKSREDASDREIMVMPKRDFVSVYQPV